MISLSSSYRLDDLSLINDLVERTKAHEPSGKEMNEYWIHAQLKHPKVLTQRFGRFDIRDVDVTVDVSVHNELKLAIPHTFITRLKTFFDLMKERDPRKQFKAIPQLRKMAQYKTAGREWDLINEIQTMFLPTEFSRYLDVCEDFRYARCYAGRERYDLPIEVIPKRMGVVSRADISLEVPAASGKLIYRKNLFRDALEALFSGF